jgi:hypothetical protein
MQEKELIERLVQVEQRSKSNTKRLNEHDEKLEDIHDLTYAVKELANETKLMREDVNGLNTRVANIENEPAQNYKEIKKNIRNQIITFILGALLAGVSVMIFK